MKLDPIFVATRTYMDEYNIFSSDDLNEHCGGPRRDKLYDGIMGKCPKHWNQILTPKESVRFYYQLMLVGYKRYNGERTVPMSDGAGGFRPSPWSRHCCC